MSLELPRIDAYLTTEPPEQDYPPEDVFWVISTKDRNIPPWHTDDQAEAEWHQARGRIVTEMTDTLLISGAF
jgi:hypothetical protein